MKGVVSLGTCQPLSRKENRSCLCCSMSGGIALQPAGNTDVVRAHGMLITQDSRWALFFSLFPSGWAMSSAPFAFRFALYPFSDSHTSRRTRERESITSSRRTTLHYITVSRSS